MPSGVYAHKSAVGVPWVRVKRGRYMAHKPHQDRERSLGVFDTLEEAQAAIDAYQVQAAADHYRDHLVPTFWFCGAL